MRSVSATHLSPKPKILLIDDNPDGILARRSVLEELGYRVVSAGCGSDALHLAESESFDLIVTDYKMSPMDGLELIAKLRASKYSKGIILLTGFAESLGLRSENTGADAVIQKSANEISVLVRQTKRLLNLPRKPTVSQAVRKLAGTRSGPHGS